MLNPHFGEYSGKFWRWVVISATQHTYLHHVEGLGGCHQYPGCPLLRGRDGGLLFPFLMHVTKYCD